MVNIISILRMRKKSRLEVYQNYTVSKLNVFLKNICMYVQMSFSILHPGFTK